jgi:ubiquinone/menaquinone biosynthesis C-methylase UbiE
VGARIRLGAWLATCALALCGCGGLGKVDWTTLGRASWQRPTDVVRALEIRPGDRVADLGAGEGFFVPHLAEAVGSEGRVYAVDVDADLTSALEARFRDGPDNVEVVLGRLDDPELPDGSIDLILIVNTYHHIDERPDYFRRLRRDLSPRGRVAILEPDGELTGILSLFHHEGHTSIASEVVHEMDAAGYRLGASYDFLPVQIFEVFDPGSAPAQPASTNTGDDHARSSLGTVQSSEGSVRWSP